MYYSFLSSNRQFVIDGIFNKKGEKMKKVSIKNDSNKEELIAAILDFYRKHPKYRMTQGEFVGLICAISQQMLSDI